MDITFELTHKDHVIATAGHTFLEADNNKAEVYLYDVEAENKIFSAGAVFNFTSYIEGRHGRHIYCQHTLQLLQDTNIFKADCIMLLADIDFSEPDYHVYSQNVVDLIYWWDSDIDFALRRKKQWTYNFACLLYWGIPDSIPNDKIIEIDCRTINTPYYFYTLLAEALLGTKAYIGANLDALHDSLKQTEIKKDNINVIYFSNYDSERGNRIWKSEAIIEILREHNFTVKIDK